MYRDFIIFYQLMQYLRNQLNTTNTLYYRDVFKADGEFEKFGRGGGVIRGEGEVFREHDSSSTSHQEQDFNRGGFFGPSGGSESDSSFQNRLVARMHFTLNSH